MNKEFLKWYLKEFYISSINKNIWNICKDYSIEDNIIFNVSGNDNIKYIISSLLLQSKKRIYWVSYQLWEILKLQFKNEDEDERLTLSTLIDPDVLFLIESNDPKNSMYRDLLQVIITQRKLQYKSTIFILTSRSISYYLSNETINIFREKDIVLNKSLNKNNNKNSLEIY